MSTPEHDIRRSIAQVNRMVRSIIEAETLEHFFWTTGKIDRFYKSERGHFYFELVDDTTRINCIIWEDRIGHIPFQLRNHLEVEVYGDVHFYEGRSAVQINVLEARQTDRAVDATPVVERLRAQGLYPPIKKPPPAQIKRIGIITGQSSRAVGDFENAYQSSGERSVLAPINWQYVMLEGERAAQSIVDGIELLGNNSEIDVIAIIRGGGRSENLSIFDSFEVVRAVIQCESFVVTGIGHHRDSMLTDQVADHTASTPTAAAQYLADLCRGASPGIAPVAPEWKSRPSAAQYRKETNFRGKSNSAVNRREDSAIPPTACEQSEQQSPLAGVALVGLALIAIASVAFLIYAIVTVG